MSTLSEILHDSGLKYIERFAEKMPRNHIRAIYEVGNCRTPVMGGNVYYCPSCGKKHFKYKSCGNRACNKCQNDQAEKWLAKWLNLLIPHDHFLMTFTLPEKLRPYARSNQRLFYDLMFRASNDALAAFSKDARYLSGMTGSIGVLHTWTRDLNYHPHIHYIIAGGSYIKDKGFFIATSHKFLIPVKALSKIFRAKFRDLLSDEAPDIYGQISNKVWKSPWVVHVRHAGNGHKAMRYLARYVFKLAIANSRIIEADNKKVTFKYKNAKTKKWRQIALQTDEFIRRFLQHVLPKSFIKVRAYGFYANHNRRILQEIQSAFPGQKCTQDQKLSEDDFDLYEPESDEADQGKKTSQPRCPDCGEVMIPVRELYKLSFPNRAPPGENKAQFYKSFFNKYKFFEAEVYLSLMPVN